MQSLLLPWGGLAYNDASSAGAALMFLHGTGCDSADWAPTLAALPRGASTVAMDFRGHGESDVPAEPFTLEDLVDDVMHLIDHLGLRRVVFVGHSLGGMVAVAAAERSARAAGLVLLEGWTSLAVAGQAFEAGRFYGALPPDAVERIQRKAEATRGRFAPRVWEPFWQTVAEFDGYGYLKLTHLPVAEVYGSMGRIEQTEDKLRVPPNPNIEWVWLEGAGHYLPHERPLEVAQVCVHTLERTGGGS